MPVHGPERHGAARPSRLAPTGERWRIVASTLAGPRLRPGIVDRPALVASVLAAVDRRPRRGRVARAAAVVAAPIYGISLLLASALIGVLWRYARRERLVRPDTTDEDVTRLGKQLVPSLGGYLVMILVGLFIPLLAVVGYLVIALYILLPVHAIRRRVPRT